MRSSQQLDSSQFNTSTTLGSISYYFIGGPRLGTRVTLCKVVVVSPFDPCFLVTSSPSHRRAVVTSRQFWPCAPSQLHGPGVPLRLRLVLRFSKTPLNRNSVRSHSSQGGCPNGMPLSFSQENAAALGALKACSFGAPCNAWWRNTQWKACNAVTTVGWRA